MSEEQLLLLQCALCNYRTASFGELVNHPCRNLMLEQQKKRERAISRVDLDDFLFCPVCGNSRLKKHEEKRRAGKFLLMPRDHCLHCWNPFDQEWTCLDQFYCFRADYTLVLHCPAPNCTGEFHIARDDFRPALEWSFLRGKPCPSLTRKKLQGRCHVCHTITQAHLLLGFPENRLRILGDVTTWLRHYEGEHLRQLKRFAPQDPRVSQRAWEEWEDRCRQREESYLQEVRRVRGGTGEEAPNDAAD